MFCTSLPPFNPGAICGSSTHASSDPIELDVYAPKYVQNLLDQVSLIQESITDIRQSQQKQQESLQEICQQQVESVKSSLALEIKASTDSILDSNTDIQTDLERHEGYLHNIMTKVACALHEPDIKAVGVPLAFPAGRDDHATQQKSKGNGAVHEPDIKAAGSQLAFATGTDDHDTQQKSNGNGESCRQHDDLVTIPSASLIRTPKKWQEFQNSISECAETSLYRKALSKRIDQKSFWHRIFDYFGYKGVLTRRMPDTRLAKLTEHSSFTAIQTVLILSNTCLMGYETDITMKQALEQPEGELPRWLAIGNLVFNIVFAIELLIRMCALRTWFWVAPGDWAWNLFDLFLVCSSSITDLLSGTNFSFIRTFRIFRVVRVARIIRVLRFFRQLRQMLFAILACLGSLAWAFLFLAMIMFMFSILFLQGAATSIQDMYDFSIVDVEVTRSTKLYFGSMGDAMLSLLAAVTGGEDWMNVRRPLAAAGHLYSIAFVVYVIFVTVGVMNVLTGVFLTSAEDFMDLDLIVQNEQLKVETFCEHMLEVFSHLDLSHSGEVDWPTFDKALSQDPVRAYLRFLDLESMHIRIIFELLDEQSKGKISVEDLVMGMVRLKGGSKAIDTRILQREISMMPYLMHHMFEESQKVCEKSPRPGLYKL